MFGGKKKLKTIAEEDPTGANKAELRLLESKDPLTWEISDVAKWLGFVGMEKYKKVFIENCVGGAELFTITDEDLVAMQISALGHRKKILTLISSLSGDVGEGGSTSDKGSSHESFDVSSTSSASSISKTKFKCVYEDDIRVIHMKNPVTLEALKASAKKEFGKRMRFSYEDADGDIISIKRDKHLQQAIENGRANNQSSIKLLLSRRSNALTSSEESVYEALLDAIVMIDEKGKVLFTNSATSKVFGYSKKELLGKNVKMLMPSTTGKKHDEYLRNYLSTGKSKIMGIGRNVVGKKKDGSLLNMWLALTETKKSGRHTFTGTLHLISEQHSSEDANSLSITKDQEMNSMSVHFALLDSLLDAAVMIDHQGIVQFINNAACQFFGYGKNELVGKNVTALMTSSDATKHDFYLKNYFRTGRSTVIGKGRDVLAQTKDGMMLSVLLSVAEHAVGSSRYFIGTFRPSETLSLGSEKKGILEEVREVIDTLVLPGIVIEEKGTIQGFNEAASQVFGYTLMDVVGRNVKMLMNPQDATKHDGYIQNYLKTGTKHVIGMERQVVGKAKNGNSLRLVLSVTHRKGDDGKNVFIGMLRE